MAIGKGSKGKSRKPVGRGLPAREVAKRQQLNQRRKVQAQRAVTRAQRPLPRPVVRSPHIPVRVPVSTPSPDQGLLARFQALQGEFARVDRSANLEDIYHELGRIEELFTQLPARLDELRAQGYVHSGHLEDQLEALDDEWDRVIRPNVEQQLRENIFRLDRQMELIQRSLRNMTRPNELVVNQAESSLRSAQQTVSTVRSNLTSLFQGTLTGLGEVQQKVHQAQWMLEHLLGSPEITLLEGEGPLLAVEAEWEEDGHDEGPDGILYLTDQRLIFEQKEEVATKKFLFITTDSEIVQKLLLAVPVREIEEVKHDEEGRGFLNLRKDDILEFVFSARAEKSRARFHIRGHDASTWARMIKRVQTGDIDSDRADAFVQEIQDSLELTASLPARCPYCFASVPPQPRGVTSVVCAYCGSTISANLPQ